MGVFSFGFGVFFGVFLTVLVCNASLNGCYIPLSLEVIKKATHNTW